MSDRLPQLKMQDLIRALDKLRFMKRRQAGSHLIMWHPVTKRIAAIPFYARDIKRGLLFGVLKQAGISKGQLREVFR